MEEIVYSISVGPEKAKQRTECMDTIIPFLEYDSKNLERPSNYELVASAQPPRIVKTHLNHHFFKRALESEGGPKFIVIARNPKDTRVSYFHHHRLMPNNFDETSWDQFFDMFKENRMSFGNVIDYHVGWWALRHHKNVLFLQYEAMLADSTKAVHQVADFMGQSLSEEEVAAIVEGSSFKTMQSKGSASYHVSASRFKEEKGGFFRKGIKGDWNSHFSTDQSDYVDELVRTKVMPLGLAYSF